MFYQVDGSHEDEREVTRVGEAVLVEVDSHAEVELVQDAECEWARALVCLAHGHAERISERGLGAHSSVLQEGRSLRDERLERRVVLSGRREIEPHQLEHRLEVLRRR